MASSTARRFAVLDADPIAAGATRLDKIGVSGVVFEGSCFPP